MSNAPAPGFRNQPHLRNLFRVAGMPVLAIGGWCLRAGVLGARARFCESCGHAFA